MSSDVFVRTRVTALGALAASAKGEQVAMRILDVATAARIAVFVAAGGRITAVLGERGAETFEVGLLSLRGARARSSASICCRTAPLHCERGPVLGTVLPGSSLFGRGWGSLVCWLALKDLPLIRCMLVLV